MNEKLNLFCFGGFGVKFANKSAQVARLRADALLKAGTGKRLMS